MSAVALSPIGRSDLTSHIWRSRVLARFAEVARYDVVLVAAGSGYGKSVALRQHLASLAVPGIAYEVRPDFQVADVLRALASLIGVTDGLSSIVQYAKERGLRSYAARWLACRLDERDVNWISLDDVGIASLEVRDFLVDLIRRSTRPHWYVTVRDADQLCLSSLVAEQRLGPIIGSADLAFDIDDVAALARHRRLPDSLTDLQHIMRASGGWPVAASLLLGDVATCRIDDSTATEMREHFARYVRERVENDLLDADRELLAWAYYGALHQRLLERLGIPNARQRLIALNAKLPLLRECEDGFIVNDVLMQLLVAAEEQVSTESRRAKWRKLVDAFRDIGDHASALRAATEAAAVDQMAGLLLAYGDDLYERGFGAGVARAIGMLPVSVRRSQPALTLLEASVEVDRGRVDVAEDLLRLAAADAGPIGRIASVRLATQLVNRGRGGGAEILRPVAVALPDDAEVQSSFAVALAASGDLPEASRAIRAGLQAVRRCPDALITARSWQRLAIAAFYLDRVNDARDRCEAALEAAREEGYHGIQARVHSLLYNLAIATDDDVARAIEARAMAEAARRAGLRQIEIAGLTALLANAAEVGDQLQHHAIQAELAGLGPVRGYADALPYAFARAMGDVWHGRLGAAVAVLERLVSDAEEPPDVLACAESLSAIIMVARDRTAATVMLARLRRRSEERKGTPRSMASHAYVVTEAARAMLEAAHGQRAFAARCARNALRLAKNRREHQIARAAHDIARVESASDWERVLGALRDAGLAGYAQLFGLIAPVERCASTNLLTTLERDILRLYAERRAAKEIADLLGRNAATVRTHIRNGMKKLGVKGREALIALLATATPF